MAYRQDDNFLLVAAIDFGTTFSGYAFSFKATNEQKDLPEKIRTNKSWGASLGFQSYKTPTSVLVDKKGKFLAFGFEAEQIYGEALEEHEDSTPDMFLFRHFKMLLHNKKDVTLKSVITSVDGTIRPACDIFTHAIRYLKDHMLAAIKLEAGSKPDLKMIRWVITVPAIWIDEAKQFMREACFQAGCINTRDSQNLMIALEPEAASLCCRRLNIAMYDSSHGIHFRKGTKYMILDCGGGTIDVTTHEMQSDEDVKEVTKASGGPWGGTEIDRNFVELLSSVFGKKFINTFQQRHAHEWLQFLTNFERTKKSFRPGTKIALTLPFSMGALFMELNQGKRIDKFLKESGKDVSFGNGMIVIPNNSAKKLFESVIQSIVSHICLLLRDDNTHGLKYILMVGGFSECQLLQDEIKEKFEKNGVKVLIPSEAQLAIIKGAVLFGHRPNEIKSRIAQFTYGYEKYEEFDETKHDKSRKKIVDGTVYCDNIFIPFVNQGDKVEYGTQLKRTLKPSYAGQKKMVIRLLSKDSAPNLPVQYSDQANITEVGGIEIEMAGSGMGRKVEIIFTFGGTEIQVNATDILSGNSVATSINFLHG